MKTALLSIEKIKFDDANERTRVDPAKFDELKNSLSQVGQIEPIRVREVDDGFVIETGARRTLAAVELGWSHIEAIISDADEQKSGLIRAHENLHREDLSIDDESAMLQRYITEYGLSETEAGKSLCRSPAWIKTRLIYAGMPEWIRNAIRDNEISLSVAVELCKIEDDSQRDDFIRMAIRSGCNTQTARNWRQQYQSSPSQQAGDVVTVCNDQPARGQDVIQFQCRTCARPFNLDDLVVVRLCSECLHTIDENV
mgnify:CR=1 FL=1